MKRAAVIAAVAAILVGGLPATAHAATDQIAAGSQFAARPQVIPSVPKSCNSVSPTMRPPSSPPAIIPDSTPAEIGAKYLTTFYPRWFTYYQSSLAPCNELIGPNRISPIYHAVVAINDDTLYASSVVDVRAEPVVVTVPPTNGVYSILHLDGYGKVFDGIPNRQPGTYLLTAPDWTGTPPPGMSQVSMPYGVTILIFRADRYAANGQSTETDAQEFRKNLHMAPLSAYEVSNEAGPTKIVLQAAYITPFKQIADDLVRLSPTTFLTQLQQAVHASTTQPLTPGEQALSDTFDSMFDDDATRIRVGLGARVAHAAIVENYLRGTLKNSNWVHFTDMGNWASTAKGYLNRSSITEYIQYGNNIAAAAYFHTFKDGDNKVLDGRKNAVYTLTFKQNEIPDVSRFWSVTAYKPGSIELVRNSAKKYLVASYTPNLVSNTDKSITITMSAKRPAGTPAANWLPIPPRRFNIMLRAYGPQGSISAGKYTPPAIELVSGGAGSLGSGPGGAGGAG